MDKYDYFNRSSDYHKYSWDEMAKYDLSANVDYVLDHSHFSKLFYIGHSQGTTQFFAAANVVPGLQEKIFGFVGMAPIMYVGNITNPFVKGLIHSPLPKILRKFNVYNLGDLPDMLHSLFMRFAINFRHFFWRTVGLFLGIDQEIRADTSILPVYAHFAPCGTSLFNLLHWEQAIVSGEFQMFDYGSKEENIRNYGQATPLPYNTQLIAQVFSTFPSLLLAGQNEELITPKDLLRLEQLLQPSGVEIIKLQNYSHADYLLAKNSKEMVNTPVIQFLKAHTTRFE